MKRILIVGATSAIAEQAARAMTREHPRMVLVARDPRRLEAVTADLSIRGARIEASLVLDAEEPERFAEVVAEADTALDGFDTVLLAQGVLPPPGSSGRTVEERLHTLAVNAGSVIGLLTEIAPRMGSRGEGVIAVLGSVAGDRGRRSNYEYGAAKAAVDTYMEGLRAELAPSGVRVLTIKPGRVDTPMTDEFEKGALWASAESAGVAVARAMTKRSGVVYVPGYWKWIMMVLGFLPEAIFRRLPL
jgi:decaprenylphospho-beta-D-erythro-pentofuranosid-2-ulose 2-reductase